MGQWVEWKVSIDWVEFVKVSYRLQSRDNFYE